MVGSRIREARRGQGRSLADVAGKAKISIATLSRIENDKQSVELRLFVLLAHVLKMPAQELLEGNGSEGSRGLARQIAALQPEERKEFWRDLAAERRSRRKRERQRIQPQRIADQVEELLAQIDFIREELEAVRKKSVKR